MLNRVVYFLDLHLLKFLANLKAMTVLSSLVALLDKSRTPEPILDFDTWLERLLLAPR